MLSRYTKKGELNMQNNEEKSNKVGLLTRIDANLREDFRIKTIKNGTTMAEVVEECIKDYLKEK